MLTYEPGVEVTAEFTIPDVDGSNLDGLTWTVSLFKNGVEVTTGAEFGTLSVSAIGTSGYLMAFTPMTDGATYLVRGQSNQGDVWEERLEQRHLEVEGSPSYTPSTGVFRFGARLTSGGKLLDCASATAILYDSSNQTTPVKNLGAGAEGAANWFAWVSTTVAISAGKNYFVRVTFTVASPGSPATPVTVVRDIGFLA